MAAPTIKKGEEHFFNITYEGNGGGQRVGNFIPFTDQATIANSVIFNSADSAKLERTPSSNGSGTTFTISFWYKPTKIATSYSLFDNAPGGSAANIFSIIVNSDNTILIHGFDSGGSFSLNLATNRTFEDTSKFYHFLVAVDTTQGTSTNRVKFYVDGDQITSLSSTTYPAQDATYGTNQTSVKQAVGYYPHDGSRYADAYLAEFNLIDGQALLPASFGITDTSTGRWIPKTVEPFPTTTTSIAVTVVSSGGNKYALDGVTQGTVTLIEGATYKFDQSDSSNSGHPLRFSTTSDGTHGSGSEYTTGVTTVGTPGSSGAYTQITVAVGAPTLYYYCSSHSGMGGTANTQDQYGTNGFRLTFAQSNDLGDDTSGKGNDLTETNLTTSDQTTDSPTQNFTTLNTLRKGPNITLSEGNLKSTYSGGSQSYGIASQKGVNSGKFYAECTVNTRGSQLMFVCVWSEDQYLSVVGNDNPVFKNGGVGYRDDTGTVDREDAINQTYGATYTSGDVIGIALDANTGTVWFSKNGTWQNSATASEIAAGTTTNSAVTGLNGSNYNKPSGNFILGTVSHSGHVSTWNFGQKSFSYTPPTGFSALQQDNFSETDKGVSGFVWAKSRDNTESHTMYDSSRGRQLQLSSNNTTAQNTQTDGLQKFLKGGYQCEDHERINQSGISYVGWNWVANTGTTASNTDGATSSTVQANTTAGFSIVEYTGTGGATSVGHGLSAAPEWMLFKDKGNSTNWRVYHTSMGGITKYMLLNSSDAVATASMWGSPTASAFIVGGTGYEVNESGNNYIAYCWHGVDGFSKFGGYTGNGNANGPYVFTGFKPAYFMSKRIDSTSDWIIWDNARSKFNPCTERLIASSNGAEGSASIDLLSNGIKIRNSDVSRNASGGTYIYMAFAEHPFIGDGTNPVTAR